MFSDKEQQHGVSTEAINDTSNTEDTTKNLPPEQLKAALDSVNGLTKVVTELSANVGELDTKSQQTKETVDNLEKTINAQKDKGIWSIIIGWVLGLIGIIIASTALVKIVALKRELNELQQSRVRQRNDITHLQNDSSRASASSRLNYTGAQYVAHSEFSDLASRVRKLEQKSQNLCQPTVSPAVQPHYENIFPKKVTKIEGYFGSAAEGGEGRGYFKRLLETRDGARFRVSIESNNAEFIPIVQVGELISSDAMDLAVDYDGNVNKSEARNMKIRQPGRAVKDGEKWIIIKKAIVTLIK